MLGGVDEDVGGKNMSSRQTAFDTLVYQKEVRETFQDEEEKYGMFIQVMEDLMAQRTDRIGAIARVKKLFKGHDNLISGFYTILEEGYVTVFLKENRGISIFMKCIINKDAFVPRIRHEAESVGGYDVYQSLMYSKPDINAVDPNSGFTPLNRFSDKPELVDLLPLSSIRHSIYLAILLMCDLRDLARHLECMRLHFRAMKEVEKETHRYVKDGKLIEIVVLLTVAREVLTSPCLFKGLCDPTLNGSMSRRQLVLSESVSQMASQITLVCTSEEVHDEMNNKLETMTSMQRMIEVFEKVGDKIELHRRYLFKVCSSQL
ncbi:hypothetical protein GQ457_07G002190 [Hibiscus cannabinus]